MPVMDFKESGMGPSLNSTISLPESISVSPKAKIEPIASPSGYLWVAKKNLLPFLKIAAILFNTIWIS
jgi:hypothetical protein